MARLTRPSLQYPIPVCRWVWRAAVRGSFRRTEGWWPGSCVNIPGCDRAKPVARLAGFRDRSGRPEVFCVATLGVALVDRQGKSSRFGFEPAGAVEKLGRSRGRSWVP